MVLNWRGLAANRLALVALILLGLIVILAAFGGLFTPYGVNQLNAGPLLSPPSGAHWLGTDQLGRDVFTRIAAGARVSLEVGAISTSLSAVVAVIVGAFAGYSGRFVDAALMRFTEVIMILPAFFLAVVLVALFGASLVNLVVVLAVVNWPVAARIVRAEVLSLKARPFIDAGRALGFGRLRLVFGELLPNVMGPLAVASAVNMSTAMLLEAGLSYLGLGDPNQASLGLQLEQATLTLPVAWWASVFPGMVLFLAIVTVNLVGDGLSDLFNPQAATRSWHRARWAPIVRRSA